MAKEMMDIRKRVEELVAAKADSTQNEIAKILKDEGFKSRRGKPLAPQSVAYYMPATAEAATKKKKKVATTKATVDEAAPKKKKRRMVASPSLRALLAIAETLSPEERQKALYSLVVKS